ncbi:MAG: hypothetical protein SV186_03435 [Candidatus Nanohaloarchaea archaeon]|nr:hypothetical protein [Candidatus Nanohaloarchaea archaeon]
MVVTKLDFLKVILATAAIFLIGLGLGYSLDTSRVAYLSEELRERTLETQSFIVGQTYLDSVEDRENFCSLMNDWIYQVGKKTAQLGNDLQNFGSASMFHRADYKYLQSKYYLYEIRFMLMVDQYRDRCNKDIVSIMYFFGDNIQSERQGNVLTQVRKNHQGDVFVFSFHTESEQTSAVKMLERDFNVTSTPAIVINRESVYRRYVGKTELNNRVEDYLNGNATNATARS